jgi:hypothetical protein
MADRTFRELSQLAELYNLEYVGRTAKGHLKWQHRPSGRIIVTVSKASSWHTLKNVERSIKEIIRRSEYNGQHANENGRDRAAHR